MCDTTYRIVAWMEGLLAGVMLTLSAFDLYGLEPRSAAATWLLIGSTAGLFVLNCIWVALETHPPDRDRSTHS